MKKPWLVALLFWGSMVTGLFAYQSTRGAGSLLQGAAHHRGHPGVIRHK